MTTTYALLGILGQGPSYGYDLKRRYDVLFRKDKPLPSGQVYAMLSRLLRDNKIVEGITRQEQGPERKLYDITASGRQDLEAWLSKPEIVYSNVQSTLFTKVITAVLLDRSPNDYLDAQRAWHISRMRELTSQRRKSDLPRALQADYVLFHLEADLRWIDLTTARLETLIKEVRNEK